MAGSGPRSAQQHREKEQSGGGRAGGGGWKAGNRVLAPSLIVEDQR